MNKKKVSKKYPYEATKNILPLEGILVAYKVGSITLEEACYIIKRIK